MDEWGQAPPLRVSSSSQIEPRHREEFQRHGFTVLESVINDSDLAMLREECANFVARMDAHLDRLGTDVYGITHRGRRYFISRRYRDSERLPGFIFGDLMREITTAFLGPDVFLFNEQWVVKGAASPDGTDPGMKFAWHQDSGYVNFRDPGNTHRPYLTCWCALDDVSTENGTISVLPHDNVGSRNHVFSHRREDGTNDLIGYEGKDPGVVIEAPAGSVAVFSSTSLHRSSPNTTQSQRRVYLTQYSAEPIHSTDGTRWGDAVPFVSDGEFVYEAAEDRRRR
ncbi:MAG: phytanoyl-CoA dioxygenase family protein [Gammaproteobacteria bacterium]|nr:phytanoyl-CoA dioxygenase family protein [Gammaproteobacteria bacterium]MYB39033.1 phytanoyl-CoA dioxygenase family protein [Gammaproteobacteria bacterium]